MKFSYIFKGKCLGSNKVSLDIKSFEFDGNYFTFFLYDDTCKMIKSEFVKFLEINGEY